MVLSIEAFKYIYRLGVVVGISVSSVLTISPVWAAPASVFDPILEAIATLGTSQPIRLPSFVPSEVELYPSVMRHFDIAMVRLDTIPECDDSSCIGLHATTVEPAYWPPLGDDTLTTVSMGDSVQGYSSEGGGFGSVQWTQGGSLYALSYNQELFSFEDAIAMATAMVSEVPVNNLSE